MSAGHEACICVLIWEWWLGHQQWIKQKSTLALLIAIVSVIGIVFYQLIWGKHD